MYWPLTFPVVLIVALLVQSCICLIRRERANRVGVLNLILGGVGLFFCLAVRSGALVPAPEFGVVMVQGAATTFLLRVSLILVSVCGALCWLSAAAYAGRRFGKRGFAILLGIALACGLADCLQFHTAGGGLAGAHPVAYLSLWFPPMLVWLLLCFSESILAVFAKIDSLDHIRAACLVTGATALFGLGWQEIADPFTNAPIARLIWICILYVTYAGALLLFAWFALRALSRLPAALVVLAELGLVAAAFRSPERLYQGRLPALLILFAIIGVAQIVWAIWWDLRRDRRNPDAYRPPTTEIAKEMYACREKRRYPATTEREDYQRAEARLRIRARRARYILSVLLCLVAVCLFDFFSFGLLMPWMDVSLAFLGWFLATEFLAQGAITRVPDWLAGVGLSLAHGLKPVWAKIKGWWPKRQPPPAKDAAAPADSTVIKTLRALGQTVAILVVLVILNEFTHYGKTVVEPFTEPAGDDGKQQPGHQLYLLVIEELNKVRKDVPELVVLSGKTAGAPERQRHGSGYTVVQETSSLSSAVASSSDVQVFGVKIPLGSLVSFIQGPVQRLLGIEVINGSLFKEAGASNLSAVVFSSTGQTWRAPEPAVVQEPCDQQTPAPLSPVESLAHTLAFRIAASAPDSSLTQSPAAFDAFEKGISHSDLFDRTARPSELRMAAACFEQATKVDQTFGAAYYRLAMVRQKQHQPVRAAAALAAIGSEKPNYVRGLLQRANVLYTLQSFYLPVPPILPPAVFPSAGREAETAWLQIAEGNLRATPAERRDAYFGLCQCRLDADSKTLADAYDSATSEVLRMRPPPKDRLAQLALVADKALHRMPHDGSFLSYYYCKRAAALYALLPLKERGDPDARTLEPGILNLLGLSIGYHNQRHVARPEDSSAVDLFCTGNAIDIPTFATSGAPPLLLWNSPISRLAIPYFAGAKRLAPDDLDTACNYATFALNTNADAAPMLGLRSDPRMSLSLGESLGELAHSFAYGFQLDLENPTQSRYTELARLHYEMALDLFEDAIAVNSTSTLALNDYAYYTWRWWVDSHILYGLMPPEAGRIALAEARIKSALQYLSPSATPEDNATLSSTLAEISIAADNPQQAITILEGLPADAESPDSDLELQLDKTQAYACAASAGLKGKSADYAKLAQQAYAAAQNDQVSSEFRPLADPPWNPINCLKVK